MSPRSSRRPSALAAAAAVLPAVLPSLVPTTRAHAQQAPARQAPAAAPVLDRSLASLMRGPELYGREPQRVRWSADGRWLYFEWNAAGTDWREPARPYRVRPAAGAVPERVTAAHMDSVGPSLEEGSRAPDGRRRVVAYEGDVYLVDARTGATTRLTQTRARETGATFAADGRRAFLVRDDNVFVRDLASGLERQLTDLRAGPRPDSAKAGPQRAALEADQRQLLDAVRDRVRRDSLQAGERRRVDSLWPAPVWLQANERVGAVSVSPGGRAALVTTVIAAPRARVAGVPDWVTPSGYVEELRTRTKVGDEQAAARIAHVTLATGAVRWLQPLLGDTTRPPASVQVLGWDDAGDGALVYVEARDYKQRVLARVDADAGRVRVLDVLRDSAWVGGPCNTCGGWLPGGRRAWFVSEADGWAHLYTVAADGGDRRQLTRGAFEVLQAQLAPDGRSFRLHASARSVFDRDFYQLPADGGPLVRLTRDAGGHQVVPSPDGRRLADVYSTANRPPELFVQDARVDATPVRLTTSPTAAWLAARWVVPPIVRIPASDGVGVPARVYRPEAVGARPNGAAVIFVHGAGYLHNVHNWWSTYAREYQFHHLLAERGYVVLDLDYRGSAGYGRDWRTAIYRHMGGRDLQDHVDAVRWLQAQHGVAPSRVGIYGGSYGGFITLMALFTEPQWFGAGAALRAVTDWAHYNHPYTARILNQPQADSVAYRRSSPIFHAEGLRAPLLMAHGMVDVNVHYQDIVRLTQRLIELGKTDWELASYPVEDHAFVRPTSWADEYRRILALFDRTIGGSTTGTASPMERR